MRKYKQEPYTVPPWIYNAIQVLRPAERLTVSEWAAKYRVLPDGNAIPGPWSNSVTPYLVEIMDAFSDDMVEEIVFVKPTQVGGTSAMENMLGSLIAQDPAKAAEWAEGWTYAGYRMTVFSATEEKVVEDAPDIFGVLERRKLGMRDTVKNYSFCPVASNAIEAWPLSVG